MKKILFLLIFLSIFTVSYAFDSNNLQNKEPKKEVSHNQNVDNKPARYTIGGSAIGYFSTGADSSVIGNGGGLGFNYKLNFNRYVGWMIDLSYAHASKEAYGYIYVKSASDIIDIKSAFLLQYETLKNQNGFVPWLSIGIGSSIDIYNLAVSSGLASAQASDSGVGFNVNFGGGVRYNYKNLYGGIAAIYSLELINSLGDFSGARVYFELGYRH